MSWIVGNEFKSNYVGYWEPHSSSVDFCEVNYYLTGYIAEFHNSWSSLAISLMGLIGMIYGNPTKEWRFFVSYLVLILIGIGSFLLHSTLNWLPQSSDEVPMLWLMISALYGLAETNYPKGKPRSSMLPYIILSWTAVQTFVYYRYQSFYAVFLAVFSTTVAIVTIWCHVMVRDKSLDAETMKLGKVVLSSGLISFAGIGASLWIFEMNFCSTILPYLMSLPTGGMTLHIIWHITAGYGGYQLIFFLTVMRVHVLRTKARVKWIGSIFPIWETINNKVVTK